jgi:4-amino-4-deoxy-L-arabinose transferase-like glycosyltransferase
LHYSKAAEGCRTPKSITATEHRLESLCATQVARPVFLDLYPTITFEMRNSAIRGAFFATIAVIAALVPFLNKAFHIDDPLFLWMAQHVSQHPADPYGFSVNWYVSAKPTFSIMQNPPLNAYYMALAAKFLGWSELAMHGAFLVPAVAAVLGTFFLAQRLSGSPLTGALLMLFTPVFLVSATTVMCDVWLLALWVWSVDFWLRGLERQSYWLLLLASLLAAAAALTKYFGVSLVPLLAVYTLVRERRLTSRLLFLLIPIAIIGIYEGMTKAKYGQGLFSNAMIYPWQGPVKAGKQLSGQFLTGLSFTGGCLFPALFYAAFLKSRKVLIGGTAIFLALLPLFYLWVARGLTSRTDVIAVTVEGALFATIGIGILALAVADLIQQKTADSLLLSLWVFGTFFFATMMNWSITSRTILPMAPAVVILLIRQSSAAVAAAVTGGRGLPILPLRTAAATWWPLLPAALVSLLVTAADYKLADTARFASKSFQNRFRNEPGTVWFEGHWGFQYYMEHWKAKPLDRIERRIISGDVLIVPLSTTNVSPTPPVPTTSPPEQVNYPQSVLATMSPGMRAGFYSSKWGSLPWVFSRIPPEQYLIFRVK